MTFDDYFALFCRDPVRQACSAAQYVRDVFAHFGTERVRHPEGPLTRYRLFDCPFDGGRGRLVGQEEAQGGFYRTLGALIRERKVNPLVTLAALDQSDKILLVLTLDIPAIRCAQRALQALDRAGYPRAKLRILVNRWSKQVDLDLREVEKILGEPVIDSLPSDYQTVVDSINLGTPLVKSNSGSKIAREISRVAQTLSAEAARPGEPKPKRPWNFFLRRSSDEK